MKKYDVILIGTGSANIIADAAIVQGLSVAIIERGSFGGTCLNRGCIPTKVMVTAASRIREIREGGRIGVFADNARLDWDILSKRLWEKIDESKSIQGYYDKFPNVDTYNGTAAFVDNHTLDVTLNDGTEATIQGDKIFIATGGRTNIPRIEGLDDVGYLTSESFFGESFPKKPYKSLIIIGGGPIGCEFAHVFDAAGTKITIVQHNARLLPKEDEAISAFILKQFRSYGMDVRLKQDTVSVTLRDGLKVLKIRDIDTGEEAEVAAEEILVAPGIKPTTDLLHIENTDVRLDKRGYIETNEFLKRRLTASGPSATSTAWRPSATKPTTKPKSSPTTSSRAMNRKTGAGPATTSSRPSPTPIRKWPKSVSAKKTPRKKATTSKRPSTTTRLRPKATPWALNRVRTTTAS